MTQTVELKVTGGAQINCAGCEQRIDNALRRLPGVEEVHASAQTQQVRVRFDPDRLQPAQVQAKLAQLGYEVAGDSNAR
jgi:copper chaperone CopZ